MISIKGIDKRKVLIALYESARAQGMGFLFTTSRPLTLEAAGELLEESTYFDYLFGRVMKVSLRGDEFDERFYDRDNGFGAADAALRKAGLL